MSYDQNAISSLESDFWPPGWDRERLMNSSELEMQTIPRGELVRLHESMRVRMGEERYLAYIAAIWAKDAPRRAAKKQASRQRAMLSSNNPTLFDPAYVTEWQRRFPGQSWGFVVYRTARSSSTQRWAEFRERWDGIFAQLRERDSAVGSPAVREALRLLKFHWIEDDELAGAGTDEIAARYASLVDGGTPSAGLNHPVCLVVDDEAMESVLSTSHPLPTEAVPGQHSPLGRSDAPIVVAVERAYPGFVREEDAAGSDFSGTFKVAIEVILTELFPVLASQSRAVHELAPRNGEVWWGTVARRAGRRQ